MPSPKLAPQAAAAALARYCESGSEAALAELFDGLAPGLLGFALQLTGEMARAEDLVGEAFLRLIEQADRMEPGRDPGPWMRAVVHNAARDLRRRARHAGDVPVELPTDEPDPRELAEAAEAMDRLADALERLPEPYRGVLELRLRDGLAPAQIATLRGVSAGTVRMQQSRALDRLREVLPASLAGGLALELLSGRGLAAVRAEVMETVQRRGPQVPAATTLTSGLLGSMLTMKGIQWIVGLAVLGLVAGGLAWSKFEGGPRGAPDAIERGAANLALEGDKRTTLDTDDAGEPVVEGKTRANAAASRGDAAPAAVFEPASLEIEVRFGGRPAEDLAVLLQGARGNSRVLSSRLRIAATGRASWEDLPAGYYELAVAGCDTQRFELAAGERRQVLHDLRFPFEIPVFVRDELGRPAAGAIVESWIDVGWLERGVTGADGRALVPTGRAEDGYEFRARRPDGLPGPHVEWIGDGRGMRPLELGLGRPGGFIELEIVDLAGRPIPAGQVRLDQLDWDPESDNPLEYALPVWSSSTETLEHASFEAGALRLQGVPAGLLRIVAAAPGHAAAGQLVGSLEDSAVPAAQVRLVLPPEARVAGRLVDESGTSLPDTPFRADVPNGSGDLDVRTDGEGRFLLEGLGAGTLELRPVGRRDYREALRVDRDVELEAGESYELELVARRVPHVRGRVLQESGRPLAGARLYGGWGMLSAKVGKRLTMWSYTTTADDQGRFSLDPESDSVVKLFVTSPHNRLVLALAEGLVPGAEETEVIVPEQIDLRCAVEVEVPTVEGQTAELPLLRLLDASGEHMSYRRFQGDLLRLELPGEGTYSLRYSAEGAAPVTSAPFEVVAGTVPRLPALDLRRGGFLELRLDAATKADPAGILGEYWSFTLDGEGPLTGDYSEILMDDLLVGPLTPGEHEVMLEAEQGTATRTVLVTAGEITPVEFGLD